MLYFSYVLRFNLCFFMNLHVLVMAWEELHAQNVSHDGKIAFTYSR